MGAIVTMTIVPSVEGDVVFGHREQEVLVGICPYLVVTTGKQQDLKQIQPFPSASHMATAVVYQK